MSKENRKKVLIFGEDCIIKNSFHRNRKLINIDKVEIKQTVLSKYIYMIMKVHLNTLLDIYMSVDP